MHGSILHPRDSALFQDGIHPVFGSPVCLVSAASPPYTYNAINIADQATSPGSSLVLWALVSGPTTWNSIWQLSPDGFIVCPQLPGMVIGISSSSLCTVSKNEGDNSQRWTIEHYEGGYTITNNETQQLITGLSGQIAYLSGSDSADTLSLSSLSGSPTEEQLWKFYTAGYQQPVNQCYLLSQCSAVPYVLAAYQQGDQLMAVVQQWQPQSDNQIWQFNYDGTVSPMSNPTAVLTAVSSGPTDSSQCELQEVPSGGPTAAQIWAWKDLQLISSVEMQDKQMVLNVRGGAASQNGQVIVYENAQANNEIWTWLPIQATATETWIYIQTELNQNFNDPTADTPPGAPYVLTVGSCLKGTAPPVEINQLQPGMLSQLWKVTSAGYLVNALYPSLVLSVNAAGGQATLQAVGDGGFLQTICFGVDGLILVADSGTVQYLSVLSSITPTSSPGMAGAEVTSYNYLKLQLQNASWKTIAYEPEISGQWFTIESAAVQKNSENPLLLTVAADRSSIIVAAPLGGNILRYGEAALSQLWQFTLDGIIVSALNPGLYLTAATDGTLSLASAQNGDSGQRWLWGATWKMFDIRKSKYKFQSGQLLNDARNQVLSIPQIGSTSSAVVLQDAASPASGSPDQCWYMVPFNPAYNQPTTFRNLGGTDKIPNLFLKLEQGASKDTYLVSVGERGEQSLSTWEFEYPGYITSSLNSEIVLSLEATEGPVPWQPVYGSAVTAYLKQPGLQPFQLWVADQEGRIINKQTGMALSVTADGSTYSLVAQPVANDPVSALQLWDFSPGQALQTILVMPPVPYPEPDGDQDLINVYNDIDKALGLPGGIRDQYQNLAAPLGAYLSVINTMMLKNQGSQAWETIGGQLSKEIICVAAVQQFFTQAGVLHQGLSQAQALLVSEMITACAFPNGQSTPVAPPKKKKKWIWDLAEGLLYTALNVAGSFVGDPEAGKELSMAAKFVKNGLPVIANLMATTMTTYQARPTYQSYTKVQQVLENAYNYEISVFQLQQSLLNLFDNIGSMLSKMETAVLADWGKTVLVYEMIKRTDTIDSLYWPASLTPVLTNQLLSGYAAKVLQTLIPSNPGFYINAYLQGAGDQQPGLQVDQLTFYGREVNGNTSKWEAVINTDVMNLVWCYGTDPNDFFRQLSGWNVPVKYPFNSNIVSAGAPGGNAALVITIYNMTAVKMTLNVNGEYFIGMDNGTINEEILPYAANQIAASDWKMFPSNFTATGTFTVSETESGNNVFNGTLNIEASASSQMPPVNISVSASSPYLIYNYKQEPEYAANMVFVDIYVSASPASGGS